MEEADGDFLCKSVERVEIENAIRFSNPNKASGPDGFIAHYYKVCWPIVGEDVTIAISDFFKHGKLLKQIKHTFFVPKTPGDFRPISLINKLYKIIVRIISYQLQKIVGKIINPCQSSFIPGRSISNNILLSHDLLKSYHFDKGPPRMCLKIDLSKAFDRVSLDFFENAMRYLNFRRKLISWIMECIRKLDFLIIVNGKPAGFFKSNQGIQKGCPLSP